MMDQTRDLISLGVPVSVQVISAASGNAIAIAHINFRQKGRTFEALRCAVSEVVPGIFSIIEAGVGDMSVDGVRSWYVKIIRHMSVRVTVSIAWRGRSCVIDGRDYPLEQTLACVMDTLQKEPGIGKRSRLRP